MNVAVVARVDLRQAILLDQAGNEIACRVRARFMDRAKRLRGALVAGDEVEWDVDAQDTPVVEEILPRRNLFRRRAAGVSPREQVLAANLDRVLLVASLAEPALKEGLIDRVSVAAELCGVPFALSLSKTDLAGAGAADATAVRYRALGYPVHVVSAREGSGVGELYESLRSSRTLVIGHSGVGKSTLLNAFEPSLGLRIGAVNPVTGRGRQTTTAALLCRLADGTEIVDTPGFRAFSPWGVSPDELIAGFPDLRDAAAHCRFPRCAHRTEPGCGVLAAVESGQATRERYESFLRLREEMAEEVEA
jgi:ribosome biogenesis GTPase